MARQAGNGKPRKGDNMAVKNEIPRAVNKRDKHHCRLYDLRMAKKLSQRELAERSGVSRNTIMNLENGLTRANTTTIMKLCKVLDVEMGDFFE